LKTVPFVNLGAVSYSHSIATFRCFDTIHERDGQADRYRTTAAYQSINQFVCTNECRI